MRTTELVKLIKLELPYLHIREIQSLVSRLREDGAIIPLSGNKQNGFDWSTNPMFIYYTALLVDDYEDDLVDLQDTDLRDYTPNKYTQPWRSADPAIYELSI